jgi:hypothetical protein
LVLGKILSDLKSRLKIQKKDTVHSKYINTVIRFIMTISFLDIAMFNIVNLVIEGYVNSSIDLILMYYNALLLKDVIKKNDV